MEYTEKLTQLDSRLTAAGITFYREEPMSRHTTLRIGGPAERVVCPDSERQLLTAASSAGNWSCRCCSSGGARTCWFPDQGLRGVVLVLGQRPEEITCTGEGRFRLPAGLTLARWVNLLRSRGMPGWNLPMAFPHSGWSHMNAGAYGGEMKDIITRVEVLDSDGNSALASSGRMRVQLPAQPVLP